MNKDPLIYLSSPYSHPDPEVRHLRYRHALLTVCTYLHEGTYLYSPILHNHPIACFKDLGTVDEWLNYDYAFLDRCDEMWVLKLDGWRDSSGILAELAHCNSKGIEMKYIAPFVMPANFVDFGGGPNG